MSITSIDVKSGISDLANLLQLGFQLECKHEISQRKLPWLFEGSRSDQKDPDPTKKICIQPDPDLDP
jgi:hypothetical protein